MNVWTNFVYAIVRGWVSAALTFLVVCGAHATPLTLTGQVTTAGSSFSIAQLQGLGSISKTVNGDTYVGVSLWSPLGGTANGASNIITSGGGNNAILRNYLLATGDDGRISTISVGEINPLFGGSGLPYLVAYQKNGTLLADPTLVVPKDPTGTRNVVSLANLTVTGVPRPPVGPGGISSQLTLSGVGTGGTFDLAGLQALPGTMAEDVTFFNGNTPNGPRDYTGVNLWDLLSDAGIGDPLTNYLLATGSDGYEVFFSLAELDPTLGGPNALVAYAVDGGSLGNSGFARIVMPGDFRGGRYVSNLVSLQVASVPEPPALMLLGLVLLAFSRRGRSVISDRTA